MNKWTKIIGAILIGSTLLLAGCSGASSEKNGIVDMERVAKESKTGHELQARLEAKKNELIAQAQSFQGSPEQMMTKQQEFQKEMQTFSQQVGREFQTSVQQASSQVAQEKKLGIVLMKDQVVSGGVDITEEVITKLGGKTETVPASGDPTKPTETPAKK